MEGILFIEARDADGGGVELLFMPTAVGFHLNAVDLVPIGGKTTVVDGTVGINHPVGATVLDGKRPGGGIGDEGPAPVCVEELEEHLWDLPIGREDLEWLANRPITGTNRIGDPYYSQEPGKLGDRQYDKA